ncbi:autotransporter-associated beta strand repeat-containing protein [Aeoliella sp.]|uniref:autotransporter-associated beta strand repeat-containing protein n=1 Tax=Aeoliella sp. TaxID=2795800 RepID=UPI003CCBAFEB
MIRIAISAAWLAYLVAFSSESSAQRAYFSLTGDIAAANGQVDFGVDIARDVSKPEFFRFETDSFAGGLNAAGDVISSSGFDSQLELLLGASSTLALSNEIDDGGSGEPDFDALISWDNVQTIGDPLPNTLAAGFPYRLELTGVNNDTGFWANELVGPADALLFTGATGVGSGSVRSLKFGTTGAGAAPATYDHSVGSGDLTLTEDLVVANTGSAILNLDGGTISVGGTATINAGGVVHIAGSGALDAPGGVHVNGGQIVMNNTTGLQNATVILNDDDGLDITTNAVDATLGGLAGSGGLDLGGQIVTTGAAGGDTAYSGVVTGTNASRLRHNGAGVLTISGGTEANPSNFGTLSADGSMGGLVVDGARIDLSSTTLAFGGNTAISGLGGDITLQGGADVRMPSTSIAGTRSSTLTLSGAGTTLTGHRIQCSATGALIIEQSASLELNNTIAVGLFGDAATTFDLVVRSGGSLTAPLVGIGDGDTTRADAVVTGAGSQMTVASLLSIGATGSTADGAAGTLTVEDGAMVEVNNLLRLDNDVSSLTVNGGTVRAGRLDSAVGVTPTVSISDPADGAALTVGVANRSSTFLGVIQDAAGGPGSLKKIGTGTFTLTGANTYTGDTIVDAGTLRIDSGFLADSSDVLLDAAATFDLDFVGTDLIDEFFLDGISRPIGTHGAIGSGADFEWTQITGSGVLQVSTFAGLAGDYNNDGVVNLSDYTVWRNNLGAAPGTLPNDIDGDVIDTDQYATWRANFGATLPTAAIQSKAVVPEPSALALMVIGVFLIYRPSLDRPFAKLC